MTSTTDIAASARLALENVCSGSNVDSAGRFYSPTFLDHVNDSEYRGLAGVRASVALYRAILPDLSIRVEEQLVNGQSVTSRFVGRGTCRGRRVFFNGITISHFRNGLIEEDWTVTDTWGLISRLGIWRTVLIALTNWKALRPGTP